MYTIIIDKNNCKSLYKYKSLRYAERIVNKNMPCIYSIFSGDPMNLSMAKPIKTNDKYYLENKSLCELLIDFRDMIQS